MSCRSRDMVVQEGGQSSVYLLNCSVCKGEFNSRDKWMEHLTTEDHRNLGTECLQKEMNNLRENSLLIFTTYDLTVEWAGKIIQFFGRDPSVWVTDFLWWEDRPRFAVIQFESRKKAEEVLRKLEPLSGGLTQIDNQGIQVKGAFDLLDLEWKALLPGSNPEPIIPPKSNQEDNSLSKSVTKVGKDIPAVVPDLIPTTPSRKRAVAVDTPGNLEGTLSTKKTKINEDPPPDLDPATVTFDLEESPPPPKGDATSLAYQLYKLFEKTVVIPDNKFDKVLEAVHFLQDVFYRSNGPNCKVTLFGSWNLKLKHLQNDPPSDLPLVYVYNRKPCKGRRSVIKLISCEQIVTILKSTKVKKKITIREGPTPKGKDPFRKGWTLECKGFGGDEKNKFKLYLFSSQEFLFEAETSNLLKYICKFDERAYQMIKMAYLWMGLNNLTLKEKRDDGGDGLSGLQWLVIFWMCHRKMVPTPIEIQGSSHKVIRDGETGVDFGWEEDKRFLEEWRKGKNVEEFEWRDDCVLNLLNTFSEFLKFCSGFGEICGPAGGWILNTRNGELIEMKKFLGSDLSCGNWDVKMSINETSLLRAQLVNYRNCRIYITHPLNIGRKFGLIWDLRFVFQQMKVGGIRLKKYLNARKSSGETEETMKLFNNLRNVFTLTDL